MILKQFSVYVCFCSVRVKYNIKNNKKYENHIAVCNDLVGVLCVYVYKFILYKIYKKILNGMWLKNKKKYVHSFNSFYGAKRPRKHRTININILSVLFVKA